MGDNKNRLLYDLKIQLIEKKDKEAHREVFIDCEGDSYGDYL